MSSQTRRRYSHQRLGLRHGHPINLIRVYILRPHPLRRGPVEAMEEPSQSHQHERHSERRAGTLPLPRAERQYLEVGSVAYLDAAPVRREMPLWAELVDVVPQAGVPAEAVRVDEDTCLGWDMVAVDLGGACGFVRDEEGSGGVHAEGFPDDAA